MQDLLTPSPSPIISRAHSFTLHCVQSAARLGYTIFQNRPTPELPDFYPSLHPEAPLTIANLRHTVSTDILLSQNFPEPLAYSMERSGVTLLFKLRAEDGSLFPRDSFPSHYSPSNLHEAVSQLPLFANDIPLIPCQEIVVQNNDRPLPSSPLPHPPTRRLPLQSLY